MTDVFEGLQNAAIGSRCEITRHEHSWGFRFEGRCWILVECPWRIVSGGEIVFASKDDGHPFGLPAPVDGEANALIVLDGFPLVSLVLDRATADLTLLFEGGPRIDVFNNSMGYEGWQAGFCTEQGETLIVGGGGGKTATFNRRSGS